VEAIGVTWRRTLLLFAWVMAAAAAAGCRADHGGRQYAPLARLGAEGRVNTAPWVAALDDLVAVAWGARVPGGDTDILVALSDDGGRTFAAPSRVNRSPGDAWVGGEFPPRVALVRRAGGAPDVVVAWAAGGDEQAIRLARSTDGGRTFPAPETLQAVNAPGIRGWHAMTLDGRGTVHTIWLDHRGLEESAPAEAGRHPGHGGTGRPGDSADGVLMAQKSALYYSSTEVQRERALLSGVCYCCKTALTTAGDATLYAAWRHVYAGNIRDIAFTASRDGGRTFDPPARVSEDNWEIAGCPDDGPALAVDGRQRVHVVWPTVTDPSVPAGALFHAISDDGRAFSPRVRVPTLGSPRPSHPQVAVDARNRVVIGWDELYEGRRTAAVTTLTVDAAGRPRFGPPTILDGRTSSYPVLAALHDHVVAAWVSGDAASSTIAVRVLAAGIE
jgi:hypothetical protein